MDGHSQVLESDPPRARLKQTLTGPQIFFIVISSVIGSGVFTTNGAALQLAGPTGMLLAVIVLGVIAVCVGESVSELVQAFPVPNAVFEYVAAFVDEDLAWVVGIMYWFGFSCVFGNQILGAASLLSYWNPSRIWAPLMIYGFTPWFMFFLNLSGVYWFGIFETVSGALKLCFLVGIIITLFIIAHDENAASSTGPINDGFQHDASVSSSIRAFLIASPLVCYGYLGVESTVMAAFEARERKDIARPSRFLHWIIFFLYFLCTLGLALNVSWTNPHLPKIYGNSDNTNPPSSDFGPPSNSATVIATWQWGKVDGAAAVNGFLLFSILSGGNTGLYIASRTLYGLTYKLRGLNFFSRIAQTFGVTWDFTGAPAMALLVSMIAFYWMPFLQLHESIAISDAIDVLGTVASVSCLIVWAALCLAFIRYESWTRRSASGLKHARCSRFIRGSEEYNREVWNLLAWLQPSAAYLGLLGCILVFGFASGTWWESPVTPIKVFGAYGAHIVALVSWVALKISKRRWTQWWVPLAIEGNAENLLRRLRNLEFLANKRKEEDQEQQRVPQEEVESSYSMEGYAPAHPQAVGPEGPGPQPVYRQYDGNEYAQLADRERGY